MKIIIDADSCPKNSLLYTIQSGKREGIHVVTVASYNHNIESDRHITVGDSSQEADIKVMNLTEAGDLVITQDWGLAAMILSKTAYALNPIGIEYLQEKIDFMLEERAIKAKYRKSGGRTKGPKKRDSDDDLRFKNRLDEIIFRMLNTA
ncbi:MAG: DUF188 domain-containing protein [Synergistaceae bacterium]|nr:DUF188 domain-containing protein [Synergistaceae bacterium]